MKIQDFALVMGLSNIVKKTKGISGEGEWDKLFEQAEGGLLHGPIAGEESLHEIRG